MTASPPGQPMKQTLITPRALQSLSHRLALVMVAYLLIVPMGFWVLVDHHLPERFPGHVHLVASYDDHPHLHPYEIPHAHHTHGQGAQADSPAEEGVDPTAAIYAFEGALAVSTLLESMNLATSPVVSSDSTLWPLSQPPMVTPLETSLPPPEKPPTISS